MIYTTSVHKIKEVRQKNAGTSDPSLTSCDTSSQQRTRNASSQTVFSPEWSQGIQELQKRSVKLRRDRYKFGRNKIIRERERNLSYCWNAFHSKTSKWTSLFFSDHDKFADPRSSSWVYCIINWLMNEHKIVSNSNWFDKLIEFNLKGNLEGIQKHISVSEYS